MIQANIRREAIIVSLFVVIAISLQIIGWLPSLNMIMMSFPVYPQKFESALILLLLLVSLLCLIFGSARFTRLAVVCVCCLLFFSCAGFVNKIWSDAPLHTQAFWITGNVFTTVMLAWLVFTAFKKNIVGWRDIFLSLTITNVAIVCLFW